MSTMQDMTVVLKYVLYVYSRVSVRIVLKGEGYILDVYKTHAVQGCRRCRYVCGKEVGGLG